MGVFVALIAAVAENGVIGDRNAIPWHLPSDFAHFKRMTMGKPLIVGRRTFDSIGRPLPGRKMIVVSRQPDYAPAGVSVAHSLEQALQMGQEIAAADRANEVMVGGGAEIYAEAMPFAERIYLTQVMAAPAGDAYFPAIDFEQWRQSGEIDVDPSPADTYRFKVRVYHRRPKSRR